MATVERIIPLLVYRDIQAAHDFLVDAFGFEPGGVERNGEGQAVHGEVRTHEGAIWLHRVTAEHRLDSPLSVPPAGSGVVVFVDDVDRHYEHARAAGARVEAAPTDRPYGQREYGALDLEGHRWWFATRLPAR